MTFSSNLSENRIRGLNKVISGSRMIIEGGKLPILNFSLGRGGSLRVIGDNCTYQELPDSVLTTILNSLLHSALEPSEMKLYDSNDVIQEDRDSFPLLPNPISSKFWNQQWTKEYLSQILKHLGYGSGGTPFGQGPPPPGYPEDKIKWEDFKGPSATNFKGNYVEVMFQIIESILKHFKVEGETHVVNPAFGKFIPKSKRTKNKDISPEINSSVHPEEASIANSQTNRYQGSQYQDSQPQDVQSQISPPQSNQGSLSQGSHPQDDQSLLRQSQVSSPKSSDMEMSTNDTSDLEINFNPIVTGKRKELTQPNTDLMKKANDQMKNFANIRKKTNCKNKTSSPVRIVESDTDSDTDTEVIYNDSSDDDADEILENDRYILEMQTQKKNLQNSNKTIETPENEVEIDDLYERLYSRNNDKNTEMIDEIPEDMETETTIQPVNETLNDNNNSEAHTNNFDFGELSQIQEEIENIESQNVNELSQIQEEIENIESQNAIDEDLNHNDESQSEHSRKDENCVQKRKESKKKDLSTGKLDKIFSGSKLKNPKFQVASIAWMQPINDRYSCQISDGVHYSENVVFSPSLSSYVKTNLREGMIIELNKYSLKDFQHSYEKNGEKSKALQIEGFKAVKTVSSVIGEPEPLPEPVSKKRANQVNRKVVSETPIAKKTRSKKHITNCSLIS